MKIYIGADHRGFQLKQDLLIRLRRAEHEIIDEGDRRYDPDDDFPRYAAKVANAVRQDKDTGARGILLCGSGQGVAMAANRLKGVRACIGYSRQAVQASRSDDDSNVLCLPSDDMKSEQAYEIVELWLRTPFAAAPRYIRRIREMDELN
jgi:ribose 5-phosphate isomerase B